MHRTAVVCLFACLSLAAEQMDNDWWQVMKIRYGLYLHALDEYPKQQRLLEIKYVCQDRTVCGVCWDIYKLTEDDQQVWRFMGEAITNLIFLNEAVNAHDREGHLPKMWRYLVTGHVSVRHICAVAPLERRSVLGTMTKHMHSLAQKCDDVERRVTELESLQGSGKEC